MKRITLVLFLFTSFISFAHKDKWDDDKSDWTKLMLAVYNSENQKVSELIKSGVDVTYRIKTSFKLNALNIAILKENSFASEELLKTKKFKDLENYFGMACSQKNVKIVEQFISRDIKVKQENGVFSFLMSACVSGSPEIVKLLLKNKAQVNNWRTVDGITALMLATLNGEPEKVKILLKYKANKWQKDANGKRAFDYVETIYEHTKVSDKTKQELRDLLK